MREVLDRSSRAVVASIHSCRAVVVSLLLLFGAHEVSASVPLDVYRGLVEEAASHLAELAAVCERLNKDEKPEVWTKGEADPDLPLAFPAMEERALSETRRIMPPVSVVEFGGRKVEVNNEWLHTALDEYEKASRSSNASNEERAHALGAIVERLRAIEERLEEFETSGAAPRDVEAEKGRLNAILLHPDYNKEAARGSALQRLVDDLLNWLRSLLPDVAPVRPGTSARMSQGAQVFVLALSLLVVAYVAWRLWSKRSRETKKVGLGEARVVLGERLEADQTAADLLEEAERLARSGDLRGAIRKAYIALLCELGHRKIVLLARHNTNRDYLAAVRSGARPQLYAEMLPLTFDFEQHWYGRAEASASDWDEFRARCRRALRVV